MLVAIPTIPRNVDCDYLSMVLETLEEAKFPPQRQYVFFNGHQNQTHPEWDEAHAYHSSQGIHFLWNSAPVPTPHPAALNSSLQLPPNILRDDWQIQMALKDSPSRKSWRMKECNDFVVISKYMLRATYANLAAPSFGNNITTAKRELGKHSWIIYNQDDGRWTLPFDKLVRALTAKHMMARGGSPIYDLRGGGLVSMAFQASFLESLIEYTEKGLWCDFKPVDWIIEEYSKLIRGKNSTIPTLRKRTDNLPPVEHIGEISSRKGRIDEAAENKTEPPQ